MKSQLLNIAITSEAHLNNGSQGWLMDEQWPEGWPGELVLEGCTHFHLPTNLSEGEANRAGPGVKGERVVFHNHAMAGNRTRTVLVMAHEMSDGILSGDKPVRMLDSLAASGIRSHRICHELPSEMVSRLQLWMCDMDENAVTQDRWRFHVVGNGWILTHLAHQFHFLIQLCNHLQGRQFWKLQQQMLLH
ncbi:MAG TPA: hypothetical protein EYN78_08130 [Candidatus Poseidoniales archaeon]|nr:hypothetical protein [Candidatus Poseidoniales archaeon]